MPEVRPPGEVDHADRLLSTLHYMLAAGDTARALDAFEQLVELELDERQYRATEMLGELLGWAIHEEPDDEVQEEPPPSAGRGSGRLARVLSFPVALACRAALALRDGGADEDAGAASGD